MAKKTSPNTSRGTGGMTPGRMMGTPCKSCDEAKTNTAPVNTIKGK